MAKLSSLTVAGKSGTEYEFDVYSIDTSWNDIAAVYLVTKRTEAEKKQGGKTVKVGSHTYIYVGETGELKTRHANHHKAKCFTKNNANCLCVMQESSEKKRLEIEADILAGHAFPCNG